MFRYIARSLTDQQPSTDIHTSIAKIQENLPSFKTLNISNYKEEKELSPQANDDDSTQPIVHIDFAGVKVIDMNLIVEALKENSHITTIEFTGFDFKLFLSRSLLYKIGEIDSNGIRRFFENIAESSSIAKLAICNSNFVHIERPYFEAFLNCLANAKSLNTLEFSYEQFSGFSSEYFRRFAETLSTQDKLTNIYFTGCGLTRCQPHIQHLSTMLASTHTKELSISDEPLSEMNDNFYFSFIESVFSNIHINSLKLCGMEFGRLPQNYSKFLIEKIESTSVSQLDISDNELNEETSKPYVEAILKNQFLKQLTFDGNRFAAEDIEKINKHLEHNRTRLPRTQITRTPTGDEEAKNQAAPTLPQSAPIPIKENALKKEAQLPIPNSLTDSSSESFGSLSISDSLSESIMASSLSEDNLKSYKQRERASKYLSQTIQAGKATPNYVAQLIDKYGADPNCLYDKMTPLHHAINAELTTVISTLLAKGASPWLVNPDGDNVKTAAKKKGLVDIVAMIEKHEFATAAQNMHYQFGQSPATAKSNATSIANADKPIDSVNDPSSEEKMRNMINRGCP